MCTIGLSGCEAVLHALGQEQSSARASLEEALKTSKAEVPKFV